MKIEEIESIIEDLDFMVESVREHYGIISFLNVAHSATEIRALLENHLPQKAEVEGGAE